MSPQITTDKKKRTIRQVTSENNKKIFEGLNDIEDDSDEVKIILQAIRSQQIIHIKFENIIANENIRLEEIDVNSEAFQKLKTSLEQQGLLQNLVVEFRQKSPSKYDLVCVSGHRRLKALQELNYSNLVPVKIVHGSSKHLSLSENVIRKNLHFVEVANSYRTLVEEEGFNIDRLSSFYERDRQTISYYLKIGQWPEDIKMTLLNNKELFTFNYVWKNLVKIKRSDGEIRKILGAKISGQSKATPSKKSTAKDVRRKKLDKYFDGKKFNNEQIKLIEDTLKYLRLI